MNIAISSGSAAALGLVDIRRDAEVGTLYVMLGEGDCAFSCSFCPQGGASTSSRRFLSRVTWPEFEAEEVLDRLASASVDGRGPRRVCLQVLGGEAGLGAAHRFLGEYRAAGIDLPVSVNAAVLDEDSAARLFSEGASRLGLAMDAATPQLFRHHKIDHPGAYEERMGLLERLGRRFPGAISTHFIAGLGETEEEMVRAMHRALQAGVTVALFALTPVRGTPMEGAKPPEMSSYRRLQLARQLMAERGVGPGDFAFSGGEIEGIQHPVTPGDLSRAFLTSGCPDCNRPYYNERPGEVPYNYPRPLDEDEVAAAALVTGLWSPSEIPGGGVSSRG